MYVNSTPYAKMFILEVLFFYGGTLSWSDANETCFFSGELAAFSFPASIRIWSYICVVSLESTTANLRYHSLGQAVTVCKFLGHGDAQFRTLSVFIKTRNSQYFFWRPDNLGPCYSFWLFSVLKCLNFKFSWLILSCSCSLNFHLKETINDDVVFL